MSVKQLIWFCCEAPTCDEVAVLPWPFRVCCFTHYVCKYKMSFNNTIFVSFSQRLFTFKHYHIENFNKVLIESQYERTIINLLLHLQFRSLFVVVPFICSVTLQHCIPQTLMDLLETSFGKMSSDVSVPECTSFEFHH